jgi:hypothetical protein
LLVSPPLWGPSAKVYSSLQLPPAGKLTRQTSTAAHVCTPNNGHLFITDRSSKQRFLVDAGSDLCVYPRKLIPQYREPVENTWQTLAFSKRLNPTQQKYSTYDRELLAIYEAVKHFRHMLEACHFTIFTDHKSITYAFQQKLEKCSPGQFNHLDFIAQFTTDI